MGIARLNTETGPAPDVPEATATGKALSRALDNLLSFGLIALLLFGPLAFGAVQDWSLFVLQTSSVLFLLLWMLRQVFARHLEVHGNSLYAPMALFGALIAAQVVLQTSVYPFATFTEGLKYVAYAILFFLTVQCFRTDQPLQRLVSALVVFGFLLAAFALIQDLTWTGKIYWVQARRTGEPFGLGVYGPYVNHNHYAGLMEMLAPLPMVLTQTRIFAGPQRVLIVFAAVVMGSSIFLSGSRGGMVAFTVEIFILVLWVYARGRNRRMGASVAAVFILTVTFLLWIGGDELVDRLATLRDPRQASGNRLVIAQDSTKMFVQRPLLGWGLDVFPVAYPRYRSFYTNLFVNQAHNDYLQLLIEMGLLGFGVMVWFVFLLYRSSLRLLPRKRPDFRAAVRLACLIGCTGILVHSLSDFNLHIPANAALFCVLAALATTTHQADAKSVSLASP